MLRTLGMIILVSALVTAILPQFTTCESQGRAITLDNGTIVAMKCKWTARAELAPAVPLMAAGAMMMIFRRRETLRALSILAVILGIFVLLIPTVLIGVCQTLMVCHTIMKPVLLTAGGFMTAAGLLALGLSLRIREA